MNYWQRQNMEMQRSISVLWCGELVGGLHSERWDRCGAAADKALASYGINPDYSLNNLSLDEKEAQKERMVKLCEEIAINQSTILRYTELSDTEIFESLVDSSTFKKGWRKAQMDVETELLLKSAASRTRLIADRLVKEEVMPIALSEMSVRTFYNLGRAAFAFVPDRESLANIPLREYVREILKKSPIVEYNGIVLARSDRYSESLHELLQGRNILTVV